ncbi:MAG: hypothetical protein M1457_13565 [bacterium]|nr:hypothetical protein [bacterium]
MNAKNTKEEFTDDWDQIDIGDQVKHGKWGVGTVLFRSGSGANAKAIVVFPEEGQKKLMLKYAKLKKVGSTSLKSVEKLKAESRPAAKPSARPPVVEVEEEEEEDLDLKKVVGEEDEIILNEEEEVVGFDDEEEDGFSDPDDIVEEEE